MGDSEVVPAPVLLDRWRTTMTNYKKVASYLKRALRDEHGLTVSQFETLDRLVTVDSEKPRMLDLAAEMHLSQSGLSRTIADLEAGGLLQRTTREDDRRGIFLTVTESGLQRHAEARATYLAVLAERLPADRAAA
jgi:DNA-binding MarR family transcriptional regulator